MKYLKAFVLIPVAFSIILISCKEKENNSQTSSFLTKSKEKKIDIVLIGELEFRRSFADIQFMNDEKEIDKFIEKQEKTNPALMQPVDTFLHDRFEELGLIKDDGIVLKNFQLDTASNVNLNDTAGRKINLRFNYDKSLGKHKLTANFLNDPTEIPIRISDMLIGLQYGFLDIIPGGEKELILLDQRHIMNGDNFHFSVYEIKTY